MLLGLVKCQGDLFFDILSVVRRRSLFTSVPPDVHDLTEAKYMSGIQHRIMLKLPGIQYLSDRSQAIYTLEPAGKRHKADTLRANTKYLTGLEKLGKLREKLHISSNLKEVFQLFNCSLSCTCFHSFRSWRTKVIRGRIISKPCAFYVYL